MSDSSTDVAPLAKATGRTALVTGGTGAVGPVLVQYLLDQGYDVRVLARQVPTDGVLPSRVQFIQADLAATDDLAPAFKGVDFVFHLAAKLHVNNPDAALNKEYLRANVEGTRRVVAAAQAANARRLVLFSTIAVYGPSLRGQVWDESTPINPQNIYGSSKASAEDIVLAALRSESQQPLGVVLRLAAVYGPRVKGNYARLIAAIERRRFLPIGAGTNRRTLVYDQDVARAALHVAEHPAAAGQLYNVTDGQVHQFNEILAAISRALARPVPRYHVPETPVRAATTLLERAFGVVQRRSPIDSRTLDKLLEDVAINGDKLQHDLGFKPKYDLQRGWDDYVAQTSSGKSESRW